MTKTNMDKVSKKIIKEFKKNVFGSVPITRHLVIKSLDQSLSTQREEFREMVEEVLGTRGNFITKRQALDQLLTKLNDDHTK